LPVSVANTDTLDHNRTPPPEDPNDPEEPNDHSLRRVIITILSTVAGVLLIFWVWYKVDTRVHLAEDEDEEVEDDGSDEGEEEEDGLSENNEPRDHGKEETPGFLHWMGDKKRIVGLGIIVGIIAASLGFQFPLLPLRQSTSAVTQLSRSTLIDTCQRQLQQHVGQLAGPCFKGGEK
jgi:hypothetical protein